MKRIDAHQRQYGPRALEFAQMIERRWLRVPEAAVYAGMGIAYVRTLIKRGDLRAIDVGRYYVIELADLDTCLEKLKSKTAKRRCSAESTVKSRPPKCINT